MSQGSYDNNRGNGNRGNSSSHHHHHDGKYDRNDLHEPVDWMTYTHEQLYKMVHTGVNLAGAQTAATNWQKIGDDIAGVRASLLKAVEDSTVGWDSESARLARDGLTEVTNWVDDTATYAHKISAAIATETDNVEAARAAMPPPPQAPEPPVADGAVPRTVLRPADRIALAEQADGLGAVRDQRQHTTTGEFAGFEAVGSSPVETLAANDASHRRAADVMAAFQRNSAAVDQTVPSQFTPPVNPINPTPPAGPELGGRTPAPVPDTTTGGGAAAPVPPGAPGQNRGGTTTSSRGGGGGSGGGRGGRGGGGGGFGGGMARPFAPGSGGQGGAGGGGGAGGPGVAGGAAGVSEGSRGGAGAAAAASSAATGNQTRAFQNPLAMGAAPIAGAPGAGGRDDEREHKSASYLEEDDNVFGLDRKAAPPVIGQ
ncbi:PPE family protein [Lentzea xinjiangensis]|uniref:PPE family protein n=1 Tax=Lentzea xinjiangensis TaxID=402600 RepID=A0A1H8ZEW8_9PSEU|nr:PPE domain-containing protein [Lentzea xinjiangensis]SEP62922.1 PPE family protein [Lentzea xinjiangensis]